MALLDLFRQTLQQVQSLAGTLTGKGRKLAAPGSLESFLDGELLFVHSSNVVAFQYNRVEKAMMTEFKKQRAYIYYQVTEKEAELIYRAGSKGKAVWDLFRIRGTRWGHKKPYVRIK